MRSITDFADQAVILPLLLSVTALLMVAGRWRAAWAWVASLGLVLGGVLMLKTLCYACGWLIPVLARDRWNLQSPSGHVASAAVTYAGIVLLCIGPAGMREGSRLTSRGTRVVLGGLVAVAVAAVVGVTRIRLGAHSLSEVLLAAAIGACGAVLFAVLAPPLATGRARRSLLMIVALAWLLFHGRHLPAEAAIRDVLGERLRVLVTGCQPP